MQLLPALFTGFKTAAATAGAAIKGATGFSATSILSGAVKAAGALATIGAGIQQSQQLKLQAKETEIEGMQAEAQSLQKQGAMKRELMRILGENSVATAAAGLDVGSGIGAQTASEVQARAATELSIERSSQDARRAMFRARVSGLRSAARAARRGAMFQGIGSVVQTGIDMAAQRQPTELY